MSKLAEKIAATPPNDTGRTTPGPRPACFSRYGSGDLEDWEQVDALRDTKGWREVQTYIDGLLGIDPPLPLEKFRYHWRRRCSCWPDGLRR